MKISELIEKLENARERLGDVEVCGWDGDSGHTGSVVFTINTVNSEGDHVELTT